MKRDLRTVVELRKMAANGSGVALVTATAAAASPSPAPTPTVTTTLVTGEKRHESGSLPERNSTSKPQNCIDNPVGGSAQNEQQHPMENLAADTGQRIRILPPGEKDAQVYLAL